MGKRTGDWGKKPNVKIMDAQMSQEAQTNKGRGERGGRKLQKELTAKQQRVRSKTQVRNPRDQSLKSTLKGGRHRTSCRHQPGRKKGAKKRTSQSYLAINQKFGLLANDSWESLRGNTRDADHSTIGQQVDEKRTT